MPGPWERYQPQEAAGPWTRYRQEGDGLSEQDRTDYQTAAEPRSVGRQVGRQLGLTARHTIEGGSALAQIPANALAGLLDLALEKSGVDFRFGNQSANLSQLLTDIGLPNPENRTEEVVGSLSRSLAGAGGGIAAGAQMAGAAAPVAAGVGRTLAANPTIQGVSATTGAGSTEIAREAGAGPVGQTVAGVSGALVPAVAAAGIQSMVRGAARGGEAGRQRVESNLRTFRNVGTTPTVGQATEGRVARSAESLLSRSPGGSGSLVAKAESQADEVAARIEARAQALVGKPTSAELTGRNIQTAISGEGGFVSQFKDRSRVLFDEVDRFVPSRSMVQASNTQRALAQLTTPMKGAEETSRQLINARIQRMRSALEADTAGTPATTSPILSPGGKPIVHPAGPTRDTMPYEALKGLRRLVGEELADAPLKGDVPIAQWKRIYAALSSDLEAAAKTAGPQAERAYTRANNYYRAGARRIEAVESVLNRNGGPEAVFRAATSGTKEGATTLRAVMQSVGDDGRKMITSTVLRRLGIAKAGVQGELGDRFSTETFLTNWNLLSTEAKATLFNRYGGTFRADMDQVAKFAANLRTGSRVFVNPSGTAQAQTQAATAGAFVMSLLTGHPVVAASIGAGVGGANLASRLMVNPRFVKWFAHSTRFPRGAYPALVNRLSQQARTSGDLDLARAAALLQDNRADQQSDQSDREQNRQQPPR